MKPLAPFLLLGLVSACAWQPEPIPTTTAPPELSQMTADIAPMAAPTAAWWASFGSAQLNAWMAELDQQNLDLLVARERITRAQALLGAQRRDNWPSATASASTRGTHNFDSETTSHSDGASFSTAYDLDLWGVRRAANKVAALNVDAAAFDAEVQRLNLQALLASQYFEWLATHTRLYLAKQNLAASESLAHLIELRFNAGSASGIELDQQRNTTLTTRAQVLALERSLQSQARTLAVLLDNDDFTLPEPNQSFAQLAQPALMFTQPAALLSYRPDIKLAEAELLATDANLFQTKQKRWPSLSLGADLSVTGLSDLDHGWTGSLLGSLSAPLFNANGIANQIDAAQADLTIAQFQYRQTVLQAMLEALESLSDWHYQQNLLAVRVAELANNQHLYDLARVRYETGDTDFLNLLTAQRSWFSARDALVQSQLASLQAAVTLFKALGTAPETEG